MSLKTLYLSGGFIVMVLTAGGFFWLWNQTGSVTVNTVQIAASYEPVDIENIKTEARDLISGLENNANIPIPIPLEKMGRENPFNDAE